jgi:predicted nucleic acid-binding protein
VAVYLLDTNIVSFALRDPNGSAASRIQQIPDSQMVVSSIVVAELEYDYSKRGAYQALGVVREFQHRPQDDIAGVDLRSVGHESLLGWIRG